MDGRFRYAPTGVLAVSMNGTINGINEVARSCVGATGDVAGIPPAEVLLRPVEDSPLLAFEGNPIAKTSFEGYCPELRHWLDVSVAFTDDGAAIYVENVAKRRHHKQSVEKLRIGHKRTTVVETMFSEILTELVRATSRVEIAEIICRNLGETDIHESAWVDEYETGSDSLVLRAAAGDIGETIAAVRDTLDDETTTTSEERTAETGRLQVAQPLADDSRVPDLVGTAGFTDGVQPALAVPLVYGSNVHGMVGIYASGTGAFSDRACTGFEMLGDVTGLAVTAAWNQNLLFSGSVMELIFEVDDGSVASRLSKALDSTLRLEGVVLHEDDALLYFVSVEGSTMQVVEGAVADIASIDDLRVVRKSESGRSVELTVRGSILLLAISSLDRTTRHANFDSGTGRAVVELPPDGDVRHIADAVSHDHSMEFAAREERERSVTTARESRDVLCGVLTERQRIASQTAYFANYSESPRGSTAEEVATSLDVTGSTFLCHLRAGQRKLLDAYLNESSRSSKTH